MSERQRKEKLSRNLERLSECEHEQIFKIVQEFTDQFTCAESGVLVSSDNVNPECLSKIEKYIDFCFEQKKMLDADDAQRAALFKSVSKNG